MTKNENKLPLSRLTLLLCVFVVASPFGCNNANKEAIDGEQTSVVERTVDTELVELPEQYYLVLRERLPLDNMTGFFGIEAQALVDAANAAGIQALGPVTGLFYEWNEAEGIGEAAVALPVAPGTQLGSYVGITLPRARAFSAKLEGPYTGLGAVHYGLSAQFEINQVRPGVPTREEYIVGPVDGVGEGDFKTRVLYPIVE
ncbi:MAG: hypothetical protein AAF828_05225 [Bacteroidota bacterium]